MPCWNCNKPGHWSRNCPYPKKNVNQDGRQGHAHYNSIEKIPSGAHKLHTVEGGGYCISAASRNISTNQVVGNLEFEIEGRKYSLALVVLPGLGIDVILGMNWMSQNGVLIDTSTRVVMLRDPTDQKGFLV
jgi:hypothetical protein